MSGPGLRGAVVEATIAVSDLDRAGRFYGDQLGLGQGTPEEQAIRYACGDGTRIFVYLAPDNAGTATSTVAGWFVDDLEATMADLSERGVTFERYDLPGLTTDEHGVFHG